MRPQNAVLLAQRPPATLFACEGGWVHCTPEHSQCWHASVFYYIRLPLNDTLDCPFVSWCAVIVLAAASHKSIRPFRPRFSNSLGDALMAAFPDEDLEPPLAYLRSAAVVYELEDPETQIGRGDHNDIVSAPIVAKKCPASTRSQSLETKSVSGTHARINIHPHKKVCMTLFLRLKMLRTNHGRRLLS